MAKNRPVLVGPFHARNALELLDTTTRNFLPLPARHEWGEGHSIKMASSPPCGEEREDINSGQAVVVPRCARFGLTSHFMARENKKGPIFRAFQCEPLFAGHQVPVPTESRNMMLLCVFFSLFSISSMASTGGTPVKARRSMTTRLHSSG